MPQPSKVRVIEMGPRDGLQNEPLISGDGVPTAIKLEPSFRAGRAIAAKRAALSRAA